ncbi:hypothetical protein LCGC14_3009170, partial [marine sediment metagenome]
IGFIGRLAEVIKDSSSPHGLRIIEKYDQVQILESPVPWPWATIDLSIKYSDREQSGWGYHVESAKAIGLAQQATTLDQAMAELVGKVYEMRQSSQSYGEDTTTHVPMQGDVWKFVRILAPGAPQIAAFPQPQYAQPASAPAPAPAPPPIVAQPVAAQPIPAPTAIPQPVPQPVAVAPVAPSAPSAPAGPVTP